jgi:RimJ/RimL family protein N-acetyltransferase
MESRISKQPMYQFQQFLWIVAVNHVICPAKFALRGGERDDRQVRQCRFDDVNHVFGVEILYPAVEDQGVYVGEHLKEIHSLLFRMGRNHVEFKGLQQQLTRGEGLFRFGFGNNECGSWQGVSPEEFWVSKFGPTPPDYDAANLSGVMFPEIISQRLAIRDLDANDGPRIFAYHRRPEVAQFQSWGTESVDVVQSYIRSLSGTEPGTPGKWYQVGIFLLEGGKLIGDFGFRVLQDDPEQAEIGITLAPEFQGKGYATEASKSLLDYLFVTLDKHRVFGSVDPRNLPSLKLLERVGMRKEAHFVKSLWFREEWVDDVIFAMLAEEWKLSSIR